MKLKRKHFAFGIVLVLIVTGIYYLENTKIKIPRTEENTAVIEQGEFPKAPELVGISGYLNTDDSISIEKLNQEGKVVLIDFWTYTCINCIRTLPYLTSWDEKYRDEGLVIIGVHTPEFEFEKDYWNVEGALEKYDIKYPVVQDNDYATWSAFGNRYWPRKYLIDTQGNIRYDHIGEGRYEETEEKIKELLSEIGGDVKNIEITEEEVSGLRFVTTPELYAGHSFALPRGQNIGNKDGMQPGKIVNYQLPDELDPNRIYLQGLWKSNPDNLETQAENGLILLDFTASSVNIVADNLKDPVEVEVLINSEYILPEQAGEDVLFEKERTFILVDRPQLYNVVNGNHGNYELTLKITSDNFIFNAFTFG